MYKYLIGILPAILLAACTPPEPSPNWYRGNLHTHSLWSDGDDYPESIVSWYKLEGYHFLALSDHNTLQVGERWVDTTRNGSGAEAFANYRAQFGDDWVETRDEEGFQVRLKTLEEFRGLFEVQDSFLLIQAEEITDRFESKPLHVNATNIQAYIPPQGGSSVRDVLQQNVDAVLAQRDSLEVPMIPHINHPNFGWAITAEDLIALEGEQFFEVYNGHALVRNYGDDHHPSLDRMWDIVNTRRLLTGQPLLLGIAVDDSHNYHAAGPTWSNAGRAWIMVNADSLSAAAIIDAMEQGAFYSSTGVTLTEVDVRSNKLTVRIQSEADVTYQTQFIGTRMGHDSTSTAVSFAGAFISRSYSEGVGEVLAAVEGTEASYVFSGDELYVRAKVISSKPMENPNAEVDGETEAAWTQPVLVATDN